MNNYNKTKTITKIQKKEKKKRYLFQLFLQASSGESERTFSIAGWHIAGRKNRLEGERLSQKVF